MGDLIQANTAARIPARTPRIADGGPGRPTIRVVGEGEGWTVADVVCAAGPRDRPFEERHEQFAIAIVTEGTFQYRSTGGHGLMMPGSLLLGSPGQSFECGHEHGAGDRCLSFWYTPEYFEGVVAAAGVRGTRLDFRDARLPPLRPLSRLVADASAALSDVLDAPWEELAVRLGTQVVRMSAGLSHRAEEAPPSALARVTRVVRRIEREAESPLPLRALAREAGLSPYHFIRTFGRVTGLTPHQYLRRARLRRAAFRLGTAQAPVIDVVFETGFGDVSSFNRAFRAEFGVSPRDYRRGVADDRRGTRAPLETRVAAR
jgi:AraC-like DNA-binding protein